MTDTTDAPDDPSAQVGAPPPDGPRRQGRALLIVAIVALVVAVAAAALALGQGGEIDDLRSERDDRREVAQVASSFAAAYMTFDFQDADATATAIEGLVTDAFAKAFSERREPLRESFEALETSTLATTDEVFVGDIEGDRARALVILDIELSSTAIGQQDLEDFSIVVDLVKVDGDWRVDRQRFAPQPDISGGAGAATSTTSSTAPAAP
jgi:Mce-associated membrane protein